MCVLQPMVRAYIPVVRPGMGRVSLVGSGCGRTAVCGTHTQTHCVSESDRVGPSTIKPVIQTGESTLQCIKYLSIYKGQ